MARSLPTILAAGFAALALAGCTGQNLEGAWHGPMPLEEAKECRTRMHQDGTFELACQGTRPWNGLGFWRSEGKKLTLSFKTFGRGEERMKEPPVFQFVFEGHGNAIDLEQAPGGLRFRWERRLGG